MITFTIPKWAFWLLVSFFGVDILLMTLLLVVRIMCDGKS